MAGSAASLPSILARLPVLMVAFGIGLATATSLELISCKGLVSAALAEGIWLENAEVMPRLKSAPPRPELPDAFANYLLRAQRPDAGKWLDQYEEAQILYMGAGQLEDGDTVRLVELRREEAGVKQYIKIREKDDSIAEIAFEMEGRILSRHSYRQWTLESDESVPWSLSGISPPVFHPEQGVRVGGWQRKDTLWGRFQ